MISATGAIGLNHPKFAPVSKDASIGYLDRVFVDMMWYKAFSVWMMLRAGYNVLFQDVDLVWFRDPFPYFEDYIKRAIETSAEGDHPDGFFSDDGQRGLRYSPFFANSGFYYLLSNNKTTHFAWSILTAFDTLVTSGSHQNVFTMRLQEGLWLTNFHSKLLSLEEFPTGIQYHHNPEFMKAFKRGDENPYNFHMCWTQTKADKLRNFKATNMWYVKGSCDIKEIRKPGGSFKKLINLIMKEKRYSPGVTWNKMSNFCCLVPNNRSSWTIPSNKKAGSGPPFLVI